MSQHHVDATVPWILVLVPDRDHACGRDCDHDRDCLAMAPAHN